jgi:PKD repeat protein
MTTIKSIKNLKILLTIIGLFISFSTVFAQRCTVPIAVDCGIVTAQGGLTDGSNFVFCDSSTVFFDNTSTGIIDSTYYCWGDGKDTATVGTRPASHFYTLPANVPCSRSYTIRMTIVKRCAGNFRSVHYIETPIVIRRKPKSMFTIAANTCVGSTTTITNTTVCPSVFRWSFGDGTPDDTLNFSPTHRFDTIGTFNVRLISVGCGGIADTVTKTITVNGLPVARATTASSSSANGCSPLTLGLSNGSRYGNSSNWAIVSGPAGYVFTGGTTRTSNNPTIMFTDTGAYTLRLTTGSLYCGTATWDTIVRVRAAPVVALAAQPNGCNSLIVRPSQLVTYTGGTPTTYEWTYSNITPTTSSLRAPPNVTLGVGNYAIAVRTTNVCGTSTANVNFSVTPPPQADLQASLSPGNGCIPVDVYLQSNGANVTSYNWQVISAGGFSFQNGSSAASANPQLRLTSVGNYTIRMTARGCSDLIQDTTVTLITKPTVSLANPPNSCLPASVNPGALVTYSDGTPQYYNWSFVGGSRTGDVTRSPNPITYNDAGFYSIIVNATNLCGTGRDTATFRVDSFPEVNAFVLPDRATYCAPASVTFNSDLKYTYAHQWTVTGSGRWRFLSGSSATSDNPNIEFLDEGTYTVQLLGNGCTSDTWTRTIQVVAPPAVSLTPVGNACQGVTINPSALVRYTGGTPSSYRWTFTGINPDSSNVRSPNINLNYTPGTYNIIARASNACAVATDTIRFTVTPAPVIGATATAGNTNVCVPVDVSLRSQTQNATVYNWSVLNSTNFSYQSGTTPNSQNAIIRFNGEGSYQIRLTVQGCRTATWDTVINAVAPPSLSLSNVSVNCTPQTIFPAGLVNYTGGVPSNYQWTFQGGTPASSRLATPPSVIFNNIGLNKIILNIDNVCGTAADTVDFFLSGGPQPRVVMNTSDPNRCNPLEVSFNTAASVAVSNYRWTAFGGTFINSTNLNSPSPTIRFSTAGTYNIHLDAGGCSNATWDTTVTVIIPPAVSLQRVPDTCGQMTFNPASLVQYNGGTPVNYRWTFGNTALPQSTQRLPSPVVYNRAGSYWVALQADNGCGMSSDTVRFTIRTTPNIAIQPLPLVCNNAAPVQLQVSPLGGGWTGSGITTGGLFNPSTAPIGINRYFYTYGNGQCMSRDSVTIEVSGVAANAGPDAYICQNETPRILGGGSPIGGFWSGTGIVDSLNGIFNPRSMPVGTHNVQYTIRNARTGCVNAATRQVIINPAPIANFDTLPTGCVGSIVSFFNRSVGIDAVNWSFGDNTPNTNLLSPTHIFDSARSYNVWLRVNTLNGCKDSIQRTVTISKPGTAAFSLDGRTGCGPLLPITFQNQSRGTDLTYLWDFGTGQRYNTFQPPTILFRQSNYDTSYVVRLTATNLCGATIVTDTIKVKPRPTANFGFRPRNDCSPMVVDFSHASAGYPTSFFWDFGNGNTSRDSAIYAQTFRTDSMARTYNIKLVVSNACGTDSTFRPLTVLPPAVRAFYSIDDLSGCAPFTIRATNYSTIGSQVWWDTGDGATSFATGLFTHTYQREGIYRLKLYAANRNGCGYDSIERTITVLPPAQAGFTHLPSVCIGDTIRLQDTSRNFLFRVWLFGDNDSSRVLNATHVYRQAGTYRIQMLGNTLNGGCAVTRTSDVVVRALPLANMAVDGNNGCPPLTVNFQNRSSVGTAFFAWDFGDGNSQIATNPSHRYDSTGNYTVRLKVTDAFGCSDDTLFNRVVVHPVPKARFGFLPEKPCGLPMRMNFVNRSTGATGYDWAMGNGTTSINTNPTTSYGTQGAFPVRLTAINSFFCRDTFLDTFRTYNQPIADFTLTPQRGCQPLTVRFQNASTGATGRVLWDFGNGIIDTNANPTHIYERSGNFSPRLIVNNRGVCFDTITLANAVTVLERPTADFDPRDSIAERPNGIVIFTNRSLKSQSYVWDFGDNTNRVTHINPIHRYNKAGESNVMLIAKNLNGCLDTVVKPVRPKFFSGLYVPNAFSPTSGADPIRRFLPQGAMLKTYKMFIYSAYGDLIWETDKLEGGKPVEGWDGTRNGTPLPQDVYVWKIQATFEDGSIWLGMTDAKGNRYTTGTLTLLK